MKQFLLDTVERAIKTFAQTLLATLSVEGLAFDEVDWLHALSVAGVATLVSILTSIISFNIGDKGTASMVK